MQRDFFDPVAAAIGADDRRVWGRLLRLWVTVLLLNLVGGAALLAVLTIEGALPPAANDALVTVAEEIVGTAWPATLARAVLAGAR